MWRSLRSGLALLGRPTAFLFSWAGDGLANPQPIHALATALRSPAVAPPPPSQQQQAVDGEGGGGAEGGAGGVGPQKRSWGRWAWDMAWAAMLPVSPFAHAPSAGPGMMAAGGGAAGGGGSDGATADAGWGSGALPTPSPLAGLDFSGGAGVAGQAWEGQPQPQPAAAEAAAAAAGAAPAVSAVAQAGRGGALLLPALEWVQEQAWGASEHVAHLRRHPEEYRAAVAAFLQRCERQ